MTDEAHIWTDDEIARIERELTLQYSEATAEMIEKQARWFDEYKADKARYDRDLKAGRITKDEYKAFMRESALQKQWFSNMIDSLADGAVSADVRAMDTVNDAMPRVYAENYNYETYRIENDLLVNTNFTLMDEDTVRRLVRDNPDLLPQKEIDRAKDYVWNKQKFNSAILQSLIQGESIPDMAIRINDVMGMNMRAAYRNARTAATAAENAGRLESMRRMRRLGIDVNKKWIATEDSRTRDTHRAENQHVQDVEEPFVITGLMYPGDPSTNDPAEVMNCRCSLGYAFDEDISRVSFAQRYKAKKSYKAWTRGKR